MVSNAPRQFLFVTRSSFSWRRGPRGWPDLYAFCLNQPNANGLPAASRVPSALVSCHPSSSRRGCGPMAPSLAGGVCSGRIVAPALAPAAHRWPPADEEGRKVQADGSSRNQHLAPRVRSQPGAMATRRPEHLSALKPRGTLPRGARELASETPRAAPACSHPGAPSLGDEFRVHQCQNEG